MTTWTLYTLRHILTTATVLKVDSSHHHQRPYCRKGEKSISKESWGKNNTSRAHFCVCDAFGLEPHSYVSVCHDSHVWHDSFRSLWETLFICAFKLIVQAHVCLVQIHICTMTRLNTSSHGTHMHDSESVLSKTAIFPQKEEKTWDFQRICTGFVAPRGQRLGERQRRTAWWARHSEDTANDHLVQTCLY